MGGPRWLLRRSGCCTRCGHNAQCGHRVLQVQSRRSIRDGSPAPAQRFEGGRLTIRDSVDPKDVKMDLVRVSTVVMVAILCRPEAPEAPESLAGIKHGPTTIVGGGF